jgi:hypothetical protein
LCDLDYTIAEEVALTRRWWSDVSRFVGFANVRRRRISVAVHRDAPNAHLAAGAHYSKGDLTPIGNKDFGEHELATVRFQSSSRYPIF